MLNCNVVSETKLNAKDWIYNCWNVVCSGQIFYLLAIHRFSIHISCGRSKTFPISAFVISDNSCDFSIYFLIGKKYTLNTTNLKNRRKQTLNVKCDTNVSQNFVKKCTRKHLLRLKMHQANGNSLLRNYYYASHHNESAVQCC